MANCITMDVFALARSSMEILNINTGDGDVNGAGRHALCLRGEQRVGSSAQIYLKSVDNEVSSVELQSG